MSIPAQIKMKYSAPLAEFNPRADWIAYQNRMKDPWGYLDTVGADKICEMIMAGLSPREIARQVNMNQNIILRWLEADGERFAQYEWALQQNADNLMYEGKDIIDDAFPDPDSIRKAGLQASHRALMAKGFGSRRWGSKLDVNATSTATVNYNFNVGLLPEQQRALEGEATRVDKQEQLQALDIEQLIGTGLGVKLDAVKDGLTYEEAQAIEECSEENKSPEEKSP